MSLTVQQAVDRIKKRLNRSNDSALDSKIIDELSAVQVEMEEGPVYPWFLVTELTSYTMTVDEPRVPLPDDFIVEYEDAHVLIIDPEDGEVSKCLKTLWENLKPRPDTLSSDGKPENYAIAGDVFRFAPTPDKAYEIQMMYYAREPVPNDLSTSQTNKWLTNVPSLMVAGAAMRICAYHTRDQHAEQRFAQEYQQAYNRMLTQDSAIATANLEM